MFDSIDISANKATPKTVSNELAKIKIFSCLTLHIATRITQSTTNTNRLISCITSLLSAILKYDFMVVTLTKYFKKYLNKTKLIIDIALSNICILYVSIIGIYRIKKINKTL